MPASVARTPSYLQATGSSARRQRECVVVAAPAAAPVQPKQPRPAEHKAFVPSSAWSRIRDDVMQQLDTPVERGWTEALKPFSRSLTKNLATASVATINELVAKGLVVTEVESARGAADPRARTQLGDANVGL